MKKFGSLATAVFLCSSLLTPIGAHADTKNNGKLVIVGGALSTENKAVHNTFIDHAGGKNAKIGIIPAASSNLRSSKAFKQTLVDYGLNPDNVEILPLAWRDDPNTPENEATWRENANDADLAKKIKGLDGIWFVGGDQIRITNVLNPQNNGSLALDAIWDMYRDGHVLGGTSAGAAIMSEVMISGGDSLGALKLGYTPDDNGEPNEYNPTFVTNGLGFFENGIVDQHFDERARLGRLINTAYALENNKENNFAYGIDEDTALVVDYETDTAKVIGSSGVAVVDLEHANAKSDDVNAPLKNGVEDISLSYLASGDQINLTTQQFTFPKNKYTTRGYEYFEYKPLDATGVFTPYGELKHYLSYSLLDNAGTNKVNSYLYDHEGSGYELTFSKQDTSEGYWYNPNGRDDYSFENVDLDIAPINLTFANDTTHEFEASTFKKRVSSPYRFDIKGNLVMVGGALANDNADVFKKFIALAGDKTAKIGIIPAASGSLKSSKAFKQSLIDNGLDASQIEILPIATKDYKDSAINVVEGPQWKNDAELAKKVEQMSGIWFVGGDQTLITRSLRNEDGSDSSVLNAIWKTYAAGAVIGGTSAGAAIMSDVMLAGGDSHNALAKGFSNSYENMTAQETGGVYLEDGLGFFPHGIVDQHFDMKSRLGRLIVTTATHGKPQQLSYGIDENTALVYSNTTNSLEVLGSGGVTLVDLSKEKYNPAKPNTFENVLLSYVKPGDQVNPITRNIRFNENKLDTKGYEYYEFTPAPHSGVLSPHGPLTNFVSYSLTDNYGADEVKSYSFADGEGFELTFKKNKNTNGYWQTLYGRDDYSFKDVTLSIRPITVTRQQ